MEEAVEPTVKIHKRKKHQCQYVDYTVRRPHGIIVNEVLYSGKVNVPNCLASILCEQDQNWDRTEMTLLSDRGRSTTVASFR